MAVLGLNIWVCLVEGSAATIIAGTRSNEIQTSVDKIEISSETSATWKEYITGRKEWSLTTSFLCLTSTDVQKLLQVGNTYNIQVIGQEGTSVGIMLEGSATLKTCKITASVGNLCQGSFTFEGNGELVANS